MEKRIYARTGEAVSLLGYGTMRLPKTPEEKIDFPAALRLIDTAYQNGVNYFDTAYMYHAEESELLVGEALSRYPRESFFLADKLPGWMCGENGLEGAKKIFADQLSKCRTTYFDFYLCHSLNNQKDFERLYLEGGVLAYLEEEQKAGRIHNLGFSFHGNPAFFKFLMELRKWDFCQIQCNYFDWDNQNAKELYRLSEEYGVQLMIMEPVRGGGLVSLCDEAVSILKEAEPEKSTASWAIRFAASLPNVLCVLSGMSNLEQVEDNLATMNDFVPLSDAERAVLSRAVEAYARKGTVPCTGCRYCFECPKQIAIPDIFAFYNEIAAAGKLPFSVGVAPEELEARKKAFLAAYEQIPAEARPENCIRCKKCMEHCPQQIRIPDRLAEIARLAEICRS